MLAAAPRWPMESGRPSELRGGRAICDGGYRVAAVWPSTLCRTAAAYRASWGRWGAGCTCSLLRYEISAAASAVWFWQVNTTATFFMAPLRRLRLGVWCGFVLRDHVLYRVSYLFFCIRHPPYRLSAALAASRAHAPPGVLDISDIHIGYPIHIHIHPLCYAPYPPPPLLQLLYC